MQTLERIARGIDHGLKRLGDACAWTIPVIMVLIVVQVVVGNLFADQAGRAVTILTELQWHLYAVCLMVGVSYAYLRAYDRHVRVDLVHGRLTVRARAAVEIAGIVLFLVPFFAFLTWLGAQYTWDAFTGHQGSDAVVGLPFRFIIKSMIPIGSLLALLSAVSRLCHALVDLGGERK